MLSLEMSADELAQRAFAVECGVDIGRLGRAETDALEAVNMALETRRIHHWPLHTDCDTYHLAGIIARAAEWKRAHGIELLVVDHIGLVEVPGTQSANERLSAVSRELKKLAKRLDLAVLAVSQLNRNVEREKRRPMLADLRDSGSIEQDADVCIFLHVDADQDPQPVKPIDIGLLKHRYGQKGWLIRAGESLFEFNGPLQQIREISPYDDHPL